MPERPTEDQIQERAKSIIEECMEHDAEGRAMIFNRKRQAIEELLHDLDSSGYQDDFYEPDDPYDLDEFDPYEDPRENAQALLDEFYPGYTEQDIKHLYEMLPAGLDKANIMARAICSIVIRIRMSAYVGEKVDPSSITTEYIQKQLDTDSPLFKDFTTQDWETLAKIIKENLDINIKDESVVARRVQKYL